MESSDDDVPLGELYGSSGLTVYEQERLANIGRNRRFLAALKIEKPAPRRPTIKRARPANPLPQPPSRASQRIRKLPTPTYVPPDPIVEREAVQEDLGEAKRLGWRSSDGRWRGERFGEVRGVPVGTVFGEGDFQRKGREEMMRTGFFRPFVTPEYASVDPASPGCFAIILNNDNGLSRDRGDTVVYAGSGGRRRGQNRNAAQSFDQSWDNVTNAALKANFERKLPVRVIRGPKLASKLGTGAGSGGYRYDGVYTVAKAELVKVPGQRFKTAMFTLEKQA